MTGVLIPVCPVHGHECPDLVALRQIAERAGDCGRTLGTRLVYAEDLQLGMYVELERQSSGFPAGILPPGPKQWAVILEIRDAHGTRHAIVVDEAGEQRPFYAESLALIRIRVEQ